MILRSCELIRDRDADGRNAPAFCAKQLGHSFEMFLTTYAKWMDGEQNALEMARLELTLLSPSCPPQSKTGA